MPRAVMRILVIRFSSLGDVVLASAALRALATAHPGAEIILAIKEAYAPLFEGFEPSIHVVPLRSGQSLSSFLSALGHSEFDKIVDLHGSLRARALCSRLKTAELRRVHKNTLRRLRMVWSKKGLDRPLSAVKSFCETVDADPAHFRPHLFLTVNEFQRVEQDYVQHPTTIGIGWGAKHPTKAVPVELWRELFVRLSAGSPLNLRVFSLESDREDIDHFQERLPNSSVIRIEVQIGLPLRQAMIKLASCRAFISSDSGLMHVADALGVPTFGLFGPTHPALGFAPAGGRSRAFHSGIWCSPCHRHGSAPCFRERRFCFDKLDVDEIAEAVLTILPERHVAPAGR